MLQDLLQVLSQLWYGFNNCADHGLSFLPCQWQQKPSMPYRSADDPVEIFVTVADQSRVISAPGRPLWVQELTSRLTVSSCFSSQHILYVTLSTTTARWWVLGWRHVAVEFVYSSTPLLTASLQRASASRVDVLTNAFDLLLIPRRKISNATQPIPQGGDNGDLQNLDKWVIIHFAVRGFWWISAKLLSLLHIGVGAQSTLGERHFCPKNMHEKLTKYPTFNDICTKNARILHNNCPKNTFSRI